MRFPVKIAFAALIAGMLFMGGCKEDTDTAGAYVDEESYSNLPEPHTKEDGSKFRLAYVDYDEYMPASRQLGFIIEVLEEYGWIAEGSIPFTPEQIDKELLSTKQIYEMLQSADLGDYIEFAEDGFFYIGYDDQDEIAQKLKERAGKDIDLVITFGTSPGIFVKELDLPWKHVYNPKGSTEILQKYEIEGFPTKVLVDPEGKLVKIVVGEDPNFYKYLDELFGK